MATTPDGPERGGKPTGERRSGQDAATGQDAAPKVVHLYVLLDRSGSMASMADDVIGGFNHLLAEQQADGADSRMTLVQFDSEDPNEVVADAVPIAEMLPLDAATFVPRGGTPLLDATARLIAVGRQREATLASVDEAEEIVFVSITDGHENMSREQSLPAVRSMVAERQAAGWTFVFLGAALDVYGEASGLGVSVGNTQSFAPDGAGSRAAFASLSHSTATLRRKVRDHDEIDKDDFFLGTKAAEDDRRRRSG